jgi:hypothetical protein
MGRSVVVAGLALVGLLCAAGMGYAAYVVSRDSVAVPVTKLQPVPKELTPARVKPRVRRPVATTPATTRTVAPPPPTTTVDDHGGSGNSGHGGGHGGDD